MHTHTHTLTFLILGTAYSVHVKNRIIMWDYDKLADRVSTIGVYFVNDRMKVGYFHVEMILK